MKANVIHSAEYYKTFFDFLSWSARKNISYHLQYIERLYHLKRQENPFLTALSLLNKTLIIEMFSIVECILDELLTSVPVQMADGSTRRLYVNEYSQASRLIEQAAYYKIISDSIASDIDKLSKYRNTIHIKRYSPKKKYEYDAYDDKILNENEKAFKAFLQYLWRRNGVSYADFAWPDLSFAK